MKWVPQSADCPADPTFANPWTAWNQQAYGWIGSEQMSFSRDMEKIRNNLVSRNFGFDEDQGEVGWRPPCKDARKMEHWGVLQKSCWLRACTSNIGRKRKRVLAIGLAEMALSLYCHFPEFTASVFHEDLRASGLTISAGKVGCSMGLCWTTKGAQIGCFAFRIGSEGRKFSNLPFTRGVVLFGLCPIFSLPRWCWSSESVRLEHEISQKKKGHPTI